MNIHLYPARSKTVASALAFLVSVATITACSVPVFRYALENWPADAYQAIVYHRGPLTTAQEAILRDFTEKGAAGKLSANVKLQRVDIGERPAPDAGPMPRLVIRYPLGTRIPVDVWSGPLNAATVKAVLTSPARGELAKRIIKGDSATWVFLDTGDATADNAAHTELTSQLKRLESILKIPKPDPLDAEQGLISVDQKALSVKFSIIRLSRKDPKEQVFIQQLLGTEADLKDLKQPMAFPVFGRGRALYALVGKGINRETVAEACSFLVGSCSCQVKEQNPGVDLLIANDWGGAVRKAADTATGLPPLSGLPEIK